MSDYEYTHNNHVPPHANSFTETIDGKGSLNLTEQVSPPGLTICLYIYHSVTKTAADLLI